MNTKNDTFSLSRFWKLIKFDFNNNRLYYIATIPVAMLAISIILWMIFPGDITKNGYSGTSIIFESRNFTPFFILGYVIFGIIIVGNSFPGLKNERQTIKYLLIPASNFEKFIVQWSFRVFLFIILYPLLFKFTANLTADSYVALHEYYVSSKGFKATLLPQIERFTFTDFVGKTNQPTLTTMGLCIVYGLGVSLLFFGSTIFKKWNLLLGPLSIIGLLLLILLYLTILSNILNPSSLKFWSINLRVDKPIFFDEKVELISLTTLVLGSLFCVSSWITAYFRLKELEV